VHALQQVKGKVHRKLLERLNLSNLDRLERQQVADAVRKVVQDLITQESVPLNFEERDTIVVQVLDEIFGLGPLEPLIKDPEVSDILVNTYKQVYIERHGRLERTEVMFQDDRHLLQIIDRIVSAVGRRIDDSSPMVDARLPDGSRVNAIIKPLALDGPHLSIRKFKRDALSGEDLLRTESLTGEMLALLQAIVKARLNVLISGGTGAGKTTLLNILSSFIPPTERIVTIEDSAELQLKQPHVVRLEIRPANIEGHGEVPQRLLLINALRMRPDRIIMGECRGSEAIDMLQAMNTGHDGSLTTLHANSPRDALSRLETMISMANLDLPERAMRQQIASAINLVIQVSRLSDGSRKVMQISEIVGMEGEIITMQDIFLYEREGVGENERVLGRFRATGIRPRFSDRLKSYGIDLSSLLFSNIVGPDAARGGGPRW
jgi:pilus assembly protein CpaF